MSVDDVRARPRRQAPTFFLTRSECPAERTLFLWRGASRIAKPQPATRIARRAPCKASARVAPRFNPAEAIEPYSTVASVVTEVGSSARRIDEMDTTLTDIARRLELEPVACRTCALAIDPHCGNCEGVGFVWTGRGSTLSRSGLLRLAASTTQPE